MPSVKVSPHWINILPKSKIMYIAGMDSSNRIGFVFFYSAIIIFITNVGWSCPLELPKVIASIAGHELTIELATMPGERTCGLSHRKSLPENQGMLFIYAEPEILTFWMKDTHIPLSIAFIDSHLRIINIQKMTPLSVRNHYESPSPALYALEVNQGWFEKNNINIGESLEVKLPPSLHIR